VVVDSSGGNPRLNVDRIGVHNFVSKVGSVVRMLSMCLVSLLRASCMVFGVDCDWVFLRLRRARCVRRMAQLRSVRMSLLTVFGQNMLRDFFDGLRKW
jgi:hypothetical protein